MYKDFTNIMTTIILIGVLIGREVDEDGVDRHKFGKHHLMVS